ncbi:hypothetical protein ACFVWY_18445 [Streptomyces sp. NPDC058195]|uniref:hypothetical protein n=1 Tax=Streptomyces sp. NPDC058195 TaxID=3346375 RepID=UPI0036E0DA73
MMAGSKRFAAALAGAAAVCTVLTAPAQAAQAPGAGAQVKSCYGSAFAYTAQAGDATHPAHYPTYGNWTTVAGYCNDINIKTNATRQVQVCTHNKCHGWITASKGVWTVIFSGSTPGAEYYVNFKGAATNSGLIAD